MIELIKGKKFDDNHSAMVINVKEFIPHSNADKLKCCKVGTYNIITSIDAEPGLYVYFQKESVINPNFLSFANLYRHPELNADNTKTGMFEDSGRIKTIKLRGELSEGFIIPAVVFENFITSVTNQNITLTEGTEFDTVQNGDKSFWVIKKWVVQKTPGTPGGGKSRIKVLARLFDRVIPEQFRFHYTTIVIKKCPMVITPDSVLNISEKIHGTSGISANVLVKSQYHKLGLVGNWITRHIIDPIFRLKTQNLKDATHYDNLYSSRTVIKNQYINKQVGEGYYGVDVWAEANKIVAPKLPKGYTAYYEIVGFLPNGGYIQKGYDYGCVPPKEGEPYTPEVNFKVRIYRITITNVDGIVYELTPQEVTRWCERNGLKSVSTWWEGKASDLYPELDKETHFSENFIEKLADDARFYMEKSSPSCTNNVPHEGVVIKIIGRNSEAFKLKCFKFLDKEHKALDAGESNIEDEA